MGITKYPFSNQNLVLIVKTWAASLSEKMKILYLKFNIKSILQRKYLLKMEVRKIIFLAFYRVHDVLRASILGWFAIPSSGGSRFVKTLCYNLSILSGPARNDSKIHCYGEPWQGSDPWKRRGCQRMRWLEGITDWMNTNLGKFQGWWGTGRPGVQQSMGSQRVRHNRTTEQQQGNIYYSYYV